MAPTIYRRYGAKMGLRISPEAIAAAQETVGGVASEYARMARSPAPTVADAPAVTSALDTLEAAWEQRLSSDARLFESIELALDTVFGVLNAADGKLAEFLDVTKITDG